MFPATRGKRAKATARTSTTMIAIISASMSTLPSAAAPDGEACRAPARAGWPRAAVAGVIRDLETLPEFKQHLLGADWFDIENHRTLSFSSTDLHAHGDHLHDPDQIIPAAARSMAVVLAGLAELNPTKPAPSINDPALRREIHRWGKVRAGDQISDPGVLLLGLLAWSRMHGLVSLEIEGFYDQVGVDPGLLYEAEIQHLIDLRSSD